MFINNKTVRIISFPVKHNAAMINEEIHLIPGVNAIEKEHLEAMQKHPTGKQLFEDGQLELVEDKKDQPLKGLGDLDEKEAVKLVAQTHDLNLLKDFLDSEKRKDVRRALEKKIKELENPTDKDEE